MDQPDGFHQTYIHHMCTREELRFGTCNCQERIQRVVVPSTHSRFPKQPVDDRIWVADLQNQHAAEFKAELKRRVGVMPSGQRIRNLRAALGWTQRQAAAALMISRRTLIRHEQGHHRRWWMRLSLLERLRQVESDHEEQLLGYLARVEP